jgi:hypothetical protein
MTGIAWAAGGTLLGLVLGAAGWRLGIKLAGGRQALDERHNLMRDRAGHMAWLMTLVALMVMWALLETGVIASAATVIWTVFLFSIVSFVAVRLVLDRRH